MTTAYTSLLGLALPVTGELSGTWGDTVNNSITSLLDSAIAGTTTITSDADVTLTTTTGSANTSRQAIILWTAGGTATRTIIAPAQSKIYTVINSSSSTQSIILAGAGPTSGVTIAKGESALCAWNGSDFIKISNTAGPGTFTNLTVTGNTTLGDAVTDTITVNSQFVTGTVLRSAQANTNTLSLAAYDVDGTAYTNLITLTAGNTPTLALTSTGVGTINNMSIGATTASTGAFTTLSASSTVTLSGGTINGVAFLNGSNVLTTGSALTFDGTKFTVGIGSTFSDAIADFYQDTNAARYVYARNPNAGAAAAMVFNASAGGGGDLRMTAYGSGHSTLANHASLFNHKLNGQLLFGVEGSEQMRLTSTGLGIGTSSPGSKLELNDGSYYMRFSPAAEGTIVVNGATGLTLNSSTASTSIRFRIAGDERMRITSAGELILGGTSALLGQSGSLVIEGNNAAPFLSLFRNDTSVSSGNGLGVIRFYGNDTTSNTATVLATITAEATAAHAAGDNPTALVFGTTAAGSATVTERARIDSSGNLLQSAPTTAPTLSTNGTMVFNLTSNTNLRVSVRGSDGVTRTANLTLA
jgi:hypothetical protein